MARSAHLDREGKASMVDVGAKRVTRRRAVAEGRVHFNRQAFRQLEENRLAKGEALVLARVAGIQAAKRVPETIPLCHAIALDHVEVKIELEASTLCAHVVASAAARWSTGVEMEALAAVSAACLTLYDMAKSIDRGITIDQVRLLEKSGGRSGTWKRRAGRRRGA